MTTGPQPLVRRGFPRAARLRGRPLSLRHSLITLVLVPVLGLLSAVSFIVVERHDEAGAARAAAAQVHGAVVLDAVRGAVAAEAVPVLGAAVLRDPAMAAGLGLDPEGLAEVTALATPAITQQMRTVQQATDAAVAATSGTVAAGQAGRAAHQVDSLRRAAVSGQDPSVVFNGYHALVLELTTDVASHVDAARDQSLQGAGAQAVGDLDRAQAASTYASMEVPLFLGSMNDSASDSQSARTAFLQTWAGYRAADANLSAQGGLAAVQVWQNATSSPPAKQVDQLLDTAALSGSSLSLPQLLTITTANTQRDLVLRQAVNTIGQHAVDVTARPAQAATSQLHLLLVACAILLLFTASVMFTVHRFIATPLHRLAHGAESVRDGDLQATVLDAVETGPREVRSVGRGLSAAVASLRRVQAQAQAVADGDLTAEVVRQPLAGPLGAVVHSSISQMISAIHERERLQVTLAHQASHDALTALPNRAQAGVLIDRAMHRAHRAHHAVGLLFIDLDHFKQVNDTLGHAAGDEVLREISTRMQDTVRTGDTVCRLGGDEFVVLVESAGDHHHLIELGHRLISVISEPVRIGDRTTRVGASIGVAISCPDTTSDRLLHDADAAAYRAKNSGRGVVEVFDEDLRQELNEQAAVEEALREALLGDELVLHYQPVLDLHTGRTTSVEALVRWNDPTRGLIPPDSFIPIAERSDLICDIGRWALSNALNQLSTWDREAQGHERHEGQRAGLGVAVNISGRHLATRHLLDDVTEALTSSGVASDRLTIEITETVLVTEPTALEQLRALRELGVKIAIDDFGTGYTSIGQIPKLPVDVLKIDRSFVSTPGAGHAELVRLVISAAHSFNLGVVAEGIEEDDQVDQLVAASCDSGQGFLFARPTAPHALTLPAPWTDRELLQR